MSQIPIIKRILVSHQCPDGKERIVATLQSLTSKDQIEQAAHILFGAKIKPLTITFDSGQSVEVANASIPLTQIKEALDMFYDNDGVERKL